MSTRESPLSAFHSPVRDWFREAFGRPTAAQTQGWKSILAGNSTLLLSPTGSGKTLAAFLTAIDRLMFAQIPEPERRCRVLYVSPLKALAVDVERNLLALRRLPRAPRSNTTCRLSACERVIPLRQREPECGGGHPISSSRPPSRFIFF